MVLRTALTVFTLCLLAAGLSPDPAKAQISLRQPAAPAEEAEEQAAEDNTHGAPTEEQAEEKDTEQTEEQIEEEKKPRIFTTEDMRPYEEAGSYHTIIGGSLGKALWKDQNREDILPLLKALGTQNPFPGLQEMKKRLLLTAAETDAIKGPKKIKEGDDFLTIRLEKLIENGWYDEAYKLYTDSVTTPPHLRLAEIGVLLILYNGDLPTACLEEKVIGADYMETDFFKILDSACALELGTSEETSPLQGSDTLLSVFTDESFYIPALDTQRLMALSPLERGLVFAKGRIRYDANLFTPDVIKRIPSRLLMLYRKDKSLPDDLKEPFLREALERNLISAEKFRKTEEDYKRIEKLEEETERQPALAEKLSTESSLPVLAAYTPLLVTYEDEAASPDLTVKMISAFLYADADIPESWMSRLSDLAASDPKNYVYFQLVGAVTGNGANLEKNKVLIPETESLAFPKDFSQALAILESLDLKKTLDEQMLIVYDKQSSLTGSSDYGMKIDSLEKDIKTPARKEYSGLTILNILKALDGGLTDTPPPLTSVALSSLENVGYFDDVRAIARRCVAEIIYNN